MDSIDEFTMTWAGNELLSLQTGYRMTFREKIAWIEKTQTSATHQQTHTTLRSAMEQWAGRRSE